MGHFLLKSQIFDHELGKVNPPENPQKFRGYIFFRYVVYNCQKAVILFLVQKLLKSEPKNQNRIYALNLQPKKLILGLKLM